MERLVEGADRGQGALFPECLEDWIDEDNPVRVIDVFVDELDLGALGLSGVDPKATGQPSYHSSCLLKLYIYGYLNRVQSIRRLEREAGRNVEVMWLTRRLAPDHKTIADFRKCNGGAIRQVCARFVGAKTHVSAGMWGRADSPPRRGLLSVALPRSRGRVDQGMIAGTERCSRRATQPHVVR